MYKLDETDLKLLQLLQQNSQMSIKKMGLEVGLSTTPVYERVKRLEQKGFIKNYTINIEKDKIGLKLTVFCQVSLLTHSKNYIETFEKEIAKMDEVVESFHISGEFDYLLKVVCRDNQEYHDVLVHKLSKLEMVSKVQSNFVMAETKNQPPRLVVGSR